MDATEKMNVWGLLAIPHNGRTDRRGMIKWQVNKKEILYILLLNWDWLPQLVKCVEKAKRMSLLKKQLEKWLEIKPINAIRQR